MTLKSTYIPVKPRQEDIAAAVMHIEECVAEIRTWMSSNFLRLNDSAEVIVFSSAQQLKKTELNTICIGDCLIAVTHDVQHFGVQCDAEMGMESHVTAVCRSAIFHLRNISRIRRYLTAVATEQVIHAFVTSRLDVCIAPSTHSESNTTASKSTELGGSPGRRRHET